METKEIIKELELNYGYKFNPKEEHEFNWICSLINDVEMLVSKNESLHDVSNPLYEFDRFVRKKYPNDYYLVSTLMDFFAERNDC